MMLGIVLVCYKNPEEIVEFIQSQLVDLGNEHKIIIVNNSVDATTDEIICENLNVSRVGNLKILKKEFSF